MVFGLGSSVGGLTKETGLGLVEGSGFGFAEELGLITLLSRVYFLGLVSSILPKRAEDSLGTGISSSSSSDYLKTSLYCFISLSCLTSLGTCLESVGFGFDDYGS